MPFAEFRVNTHTVNDQTRSSVAMDADGDFVVAWQGSGQDGSFDGIYAQRYNARGVAQGGEFRVNTYTTDYQSDPAVAMDALGNFVVVWQSSGQDGSFDGIYGQRYNASGVAQGSEFRVNTFTLGFQAAPAVAMDASGNFVVVWQSDGQDGDGDGVYAQRNSASGLALGGEFRVNTYTASIQRDAAVAMNPSGGFVIVWHSNGQDGSGGGIYAKRYDAQGAEQAPSPASGTGALGNEFRVNTYTTNNQVAPSISMDDAGGFVVAWTSDRQDGSGDGIYAQRFDPAAVARGIEFQVNTYTLNSQFEPSVAMDADGDFVVTWQSFGQDGFAGGIYGQRFAGSGTMQGSEFRINTYTPEAQIDQAIAMNDAGGFIVTWSSYGQDSSSYGIYGQQYNADGSVPAEPLPKATKVYTLSDVWPSPAKVDASFTLAVAERQQVTIAVLDVVGREVLRLYEGPMEANQEQRFNVRSLTPGAYMVRVLGEHFMGTKVFTYSR